MNNFFRKTSSLLLAVFISFIVASCSSSSDSGSNNNAEITADNMEALATAGTEGVKQAVNSDNLSPFAQINNPSLAQQITVSAVQQASQRPTLAEGDFAICDTGSVSGFDSIDENGGTITYDTCVIGDVTINGTMIITASSSGDILTYSITADITFTSLEGVENVDFSSTCTINQSTGATSCTYDSTALGIDGRTYSVSDISVTGDDFSGYSVSATITDPDHGVITITTTTPVTFVGCSNGQPDSGVIVISDGTDTMTVTYIDCTSFSIDFNGSTTTYDW